MTNADYECGFFRKKPVIIAAFYWDGVSVDELDAWSEQWPSAHWPFYSDGEDILVRTLEGEMRANPGDWIIRGVQGEFYPCKPDIFEATYERVANGGEATE